MRLKHYKKELEGNKIVFTVELAEKIVDEDEATKFAIAAILECAGINPTDFVLYPIKVEI